MGLFKAQGPVKLGGIYLEGKPERFANYTTKDVLPVYDWCGAFVAACLPNSGLTKRLRLQIILVSLNLVSIKNKP